MSNRLEELYEKMVDEAPFIFPESNRAYVLELAKRYAKDCSKASLEKASENVKMIDEIDTPHWVDKNSITNPDNIVIL